MKPLDPITQDRQTALQQMINAQLFAPSTSTVPQGKEEKIWAKLIIALATLRG